MEFQLKFVLIGDAETGKSSFLSALDKKPFLNEYEATIGASSMSKSFQIDSYTFKANFFDTSGQPRYRPLSRMFYRDASACILFYDITNHNSFINIDSYIQEINANSPNAKIFVVGNKNDLDENREVFFEDAKKHFDDLGLQFLEISCKNDFMVTETIFLAFKVLNLEKDFSD